MKIGYQGAVYSNNEYVAKTLFPNEQHIPLISSENVCNALYKQEIDYGIMALYNSIGKRVDETYHVLSDNSLVLKDVYGIQIKHFLFAKTNDVFALKEVWSHPQALKQTAKWRNAYIPFAKEVELTALHGHKVPAGSQGR